MKIVALNKKVLSIICMVQSAKSLFVCETDLIEFRIKKEPQEYSENMTGDLDWLTRTRNYYFAIDDGFISGLGLKKSESCFKAINNFKITDQIRNTDYNDLGKFELVY
jgi:hypothetical protein